MADRPFARVYYVDLERDYPDIYRDNDALSTYVRLLAVADAMWPAVPEVPRSAKAPFVRKLVEASLVRMVAPYGFTIKGLDAERTARSNAASIAARSRWGTTDGTAIGNAISRPVQTKPAEPTPIRAQSAPKMTGTIVDERDLPEEEKQRRYVERMAKRTGVDAS